VTPKSAWEGVPEKFPFFDAFPIYTQGFYPPKTDTQSRDSFCFIIFNQFKPPV